ncbi:MAG: glycosyltransferase family 8 protein [Clostridiales bacterium]|nr:glycosyltransferase family 8 protein [Clostridiales bacterium]
MSEPMVLLTTLNENYLPQLEVLLTSVLLSNPSERFQLYLVHRSFSAERLEELDSRCRQWNVELFPVHVDETIFADAPVTRQYPQEMYYRLLAPQLLPETLERILYLDPDILVINPIRSLWELDLEGNLFAAAAHTGKTEIANDANRIRLKMENEYYNSGVLLIDLARGREEIVPEQIFQFAKEHPKGLILPDQDILNVLFGDRIKPLDDYIWNYDARKYSSYQFRSAGKSDVSWVMEHTAILHFCGKAKPWKPLYRHRFGVLYKHYQRLAERFFVSTLDEKDEKKEVDA